MSEEKLCTHTHDNGQPCQAFRVHNSPFCYFHRKFHQPTALPGERGYQAPLLESHESIQLATTHLYMSFVTGKIPLSAARFALNLLRLASKSVFAIEKNRREQEKKQQQQQEEQQEKADGRRSPSTGTTTAADGRPSQECDGRRSPSTGKATAEAPQPTSPANPTPAYKGPRYIDPYGCMPKEEATK